MLKLPSGCAVPWPGVARLRTTRRPSATRTRRLPMIAFCRPYAPSGCLDSRSLSRRQPPRPRTGLAPPPGDRDRLHLRALRLLIRLVDELHDTSAISDGLWREVAAAFSVEQIFELIALVGFYHTVSFFADGLKLAPEPFAAPPPSA